MIGFFVGAQPTVISGQVFDQESYEPLPFVNITYNQTCNGTAADINGRFTLQAEGGITSLAFSFVGYETFTMPITQNTPLPLQIYMQPAATQLAEIEVVAGENPAHRIIRNAVANREVNNPENLNSFSYTSYNKLILTISTDSLPLLDTLGNVDSAMVALQEFTEQQHLFLMETASQRIYKKPNKSTERVIANRVSGFKNPSFVLLASQLQSFSFYTDFVTVLDVDYLNPISKGSTKKYLFLLQDTTFSGTDTTFVIRFRPFKNPNFNALSGLIYLNSSSWAIQNVIAEPVVQAGFNIKIQQLYRRFEQGWFLIQLNYDFEFNNLNINGLSPIGVGRTYLTDIKINPALQNKDFDVVAVKIEPDATEKDPTFWRDYRQDSLTEKETETYRTIDSIGQAERFEQRLKWLQALGEGKIRYGILDFPIDQLLRFNIYEGIRLGLAAETNPKLAKWLRLGGNVAYGFGDEVWKWGYFGEVIINQRQNFRIGGGYGFDIYESGGTHWIDPEKPSIFRDNNYRQIWLQQFDELSQGFGYISWHPRPNLHTKLQVSRENRYMPGDYFYQTTTEIGATRLQNGFVAGLLQASIHWAPNDAYMEGPFGRRPIKKTYPTIMAQYSQGVDGLLGGTLSFNRLDLKLRHDLKTRRFGITSMALLAGKVWGDVPYSYLFAGRSNLPNNFGWRLLVADANSFETMHNNEFLNDAYVSLFFRQDFQSRLLRFGTWQPEVAIVARALWGQLQNAYRHTGIGVSDAQNGYYETGLELNKIVSGMGIGAYYRIGNYQLPKGIDNWSFKITYRFRLFE